MQANPITSEQAIAQTKAIELAVSNAAYLKQDGAYIIAEYLGGSHLYGLNTHESDVDVRGVFVNTESRFILGTRRFEELRKQNHVLKEDIVYKELSHFMTLLQAANTEALEVLFADSSVFNTISSEFTQIRYYADSLVDSEKLFKCLRGYMQGEYRLAIGERKGQIGGKRYAKLQEVGFSPKNFTQLFRLAYVGQTFFNENRFATNVKNEPIYEKLMAIKTRPEEFTKDQLTVMYKEAEVDLEKAYANRLVTRYFDEERANALLLDAYLPHLQKRYKLDSQWKNGKSG